MIYCLQCECGFESNTQLYGEGRGTDSYFIPVYVPASERLESLEICRQLGQTDDEFDQVLLTQIDTLVEQRLGPDAIHATSAVVLGDANLQCPRCGNNSATFQFRGFS
jgi:hypothetical protein